jgi:UDP-2,3-diacylglucosamine hydrolase
MATDLAQATGYKALKKLFRNPICQSLFGLVPPRIGIGLADYFSRKSRAATGTSEEHFLGEDREWLITYCKTVLQQKKIDYFVFGHRHLPFDYRLSAESRYINLGDWVQYFTYAVFNEAGMQLKTCGGDENKIIRKE